MEGMCTLTKNSYFSSSLLLTCTAFFLLVAHALYCTCTFPFGPCECSLSAHGQYSQALKYYLEVGVVCTDYFSLPVTKSVYDDQVSYTNKQWHPSIVVLVPFLCFIYVVARPGVTQESVNSYFQCGPRGDYMAYRDSEGGYCQGTCHPQWFFCIPSQSDGTAI